MVDDVAPRAPSYPLSRPATAPLREVLTVRGLTVTTRTDRLVGEDPLEIRVAGPRQMPVRVAVTMRTPGSEHELAAGFLITEGLVAPGEVTGFESGDPTRMSEPDNEITVRISRRFDPKTLPGRSFVASASCGICGKSSIDDVALRCPPLPSGPRVRGSSILDMPMSMRDAQSVFDRTGGLHAAALFRPDGSLLDIREDVGRHNALDKLVGAAALRGELPFRGGVLVVSGRVSFEIAQKAAMAGAPVLVAISAPSDLAVATAERLGMTLVGFVRDVSFNVYAGRERIEVLA
jgi:FdhD protein